MSLILIFLGFILLENAILEKLLKTNPLYDDSKKEKENFMLALAIIINITLSSLLTYFIYTLASINIQYVKAIIFLIIVISITLAIHMIIKKNKTPYSDMVINYELAILNCAIFTVVLLNLQTEYTLINVLGSSLFISTGYMVSIYVFESIRERMNRAPILRVLRGFPIAVITIFIILLIFYSYI
ncbi:MAG: Rnf-Nqr domain containing protein [Bacilli bacterium]|nr:Rnf-Nqr domain containing protein [Bacilli bacterium]MDD3305288.1 Rnf-Nqr domain containing protein [Bacilli bacterium]MDD4053578.1 Rnf-Nqr domain containing protein [Bacilli bacterium]MDD4411455.1 Rnf-Nqr domain containing protein [Bacilli bacterium]